MTRIKICGITNIEDARAAIGCGADALGFIFVPESPRFVGGFETVQNLIAEIPPLIAKVAVCRRAEDIDPRLVDAFQAIQFYEPDTDAAPLRQRWQALIYAARVLDGGSLNAIEAALESPAIPGNSAKVRALLLDTYHNERLGGSGETFNWDLAIEAKRRFRLPLILAGGLTPANVEEAIRRVRPFAIDVASGVEAQPGRKDHALLRQFISAARRADEALPQA